MAEAELGGYNADGGIVYAPSHWRPQFRPQSTTGFHDPSHTQAQRHSAASSRSNSITRMDRTNSDSGISMRDTSPEMLEKLPKSSPLTRHDSAVERHVEQKQEEDQEESSDDDSEDDEDETTGQIDVSQYQVASYDEDRHLREELSDRQSEASNHILQSPQPRRYHTFARPRYDVQPGVQHMPYQDLHQQAAYQQRRTSLTGSQMFAPNSSLSYAQRPGPFAHAFVDDDSSRETKVGYELLASKLADQTGGTLGSSRDEPFAPLYRRFDFLNHRVLLHLQDEISELEEELRRIDEMIARQQGHFEPPQEESTRGESKSQAEPISRREEIRSGNELCERRSHILGRIYTRLEQYNKALASYRSATTGFEPADGEQIQRYRAWMDANKPVHEAESRFLNFDKDLIAVRSQPTGTTTSMADASRKPVEVSHAHKLIVLAALTCVPMALFALAPDVYSKALVVAGTVAASGFLSSDISRTLSLGPW